MSGREERKREGEEERRDEVLWWEVGDERSDAIPGHAWRWKSN